VLKQHVLVLNTQELVDWQVVIKPPFRIGDTSIMRYTLTALEDIVQPIQIEMHLDNMELLTVPQKISPPFLTGSVVVREIKVVPIAAREVNQIVFNLMRLDDEGRASSTTGLLCSAFFNSDGTLRMVGDVSTTAAHEQYEPPGFRELKPGSGETVRIRSDRDRVKRIFYDSVPVVIPESNGSYFKEKRK